jgi:hypothetical protein
MAVLGLPAILMVDQHAVPTFPIPNGLGISETLIGNVIPNPGHGPRCSRKDINTALHFDKISKSKIRPVMAVVRQSAAVKIPPVRRRVGIDVVLNETIYA